MVDNCEYPQDKTHCLVCALGYTTNFDKTKCLQNSSVQNCLLFSPVQCNKCDKNSILTPNIYQIEWLQKEQDQKLKILYQQYKKITQHFPINFCQKLEIKNCLVYSNFETCQSCESGFYLLENSCIQYPKNYIENCEKYLNYDKCEQCARDYHLTSDYKCEENQKIEFCQQYNN